MGKEKDCGYCQERVSEDGVEIKGFREEWGESKIDVLYVWVGTTSDNKLAGLIRTLEILERTHRDGLLDIGYVTMITGKMRTSIPEEEDFLHGESVAKQKARDYWEMFKGQPRIQKCRFYNNCESDHLVIASDVCGWVGGAGQEFSQSLLKPPSNLTRQGLIEYIMEPYQNLLETVGSEGYVVNRMEAAVSMLSPTTQKWGRSRVVNGVSRASLQFPIKTMLEPGFVERYLERAIEATGGNMGAVKGAAGGLMHEYLLEQMQQEDKQVLLSMKPDDRFDSERELLKAHALGFPPRLVWGLLQRMYGRGESRSGEVLVMEPDMW